MRLPRPPTDPDELWWLVNAMWDVQLPRQRICDHHTAPFDAFSEAFFGNLANWVLWYGSRGTGKSYMLAILALTKSAVLDVNVTLLGGSMAQSQNVHEHVSDLLRRPNAPLFAIEKAIKTEIVFTGGNWIRPLPASQKTVRGPHPHMTCLDEIDEMEKSIYDAAQGQALEKPNAKGFVVPEMTVASSTWQNPIGTFSKVKAEAEEKGLPVRTWCFREVLKTKKNTSGWMKPDFIERKRASVPAEMFRVEYDLGEPSGTSRAFDLAALSRCVVSVPPVREFHKVNDELLVFEEAVKHGYYATGADWAKENDKTVIVTWRTDVEPHRLVHIRAMNRKPWPEMIGVFNAICKHYPGDSSHDATGIGNVVGDLIDERTIKFVMVGRERTRMLTEYIAAVEQGRYAIPADAVRFLQAHRNATVDDIYSIGDTKMAHLPDEVAAAALAHRANTRGAPPVPAQGSAKASAEEEIMPSWMRSTDTYPKDVQHAIVQGTVVQVETDDDIGVFWLSD